MKALLIDVGSTSVKWTETNGDAVGAVGRRPFPSRLPLPAPYVEMNPEEIARIITEIVDGSAAERVYLSTQMHGWLLADKSGKLLTNYISWQDGRGGLVPFPIALSARHGVGVKPNLPRAGVYAMRTLFPAVAAQAKIFYTLGSYLVWLLTGENATHITDAAASGYYDAVTCRPDECELSLPHACDRLVPVGAYRGKMIYSPVGDQQASVLGAEGGEDCYILNLGTAAQLCAIAPSFSEGAFESRPYFRGKTLLTVTGLYGGKYLAEQAGGEGLSRRLEENYRAALTRLPARDRLLATGGALRYHGKVLAEALRALALPIRLNKEADALEGLRILSGEEEK